MSSALFLRRGVVGMILLLHPALGGCEQSSGQDSAATQPSADAARSFVVVELFTSEGCSSCSPADALLAKLVSDSRDQKLPVFALAYHVDYWNSLGWKDPFSSADFSSRQQAYAAAANSDQVYTPQMLVNGQGAGFVGSDAIEANRQVKAALQRAETVHIKMTTALPKDGKIVVNYRVNGLAAGDVINLALVEKSATIDVKRGENGGKTLSHIHVVRSLVSPLLSADQKGESDLLLPEGLDINNVAIIAYVQNPGSKEILGATSVDLP